MGRFDLRRGSFLQARDVIIDGRLLRESWMLRRLEVFTEQATKSAPRTKLIELRYCQHIRHKGIHTRYDFTALCRFRE